MKKLLSLFLALALWAGLGIPASAAGFTDVAANSPFAPAIAWAVERGVTKGTTPTTFGPGNTCTTSHILTFLWRAAGRPGDAGNERAAVSAWASGLGISVSDLSAPCTRAAAVTDIWKAQGSPAAKTAAFFADVDPSAPYAGAVSWAVEAGVTKGTGGGAFSPESVCTRGQIVTFLYRAMGDEKTAEVPEETEAPAYVLSNGKDITEENVLAVIQELLKKYPNGTTWNGNTTRPGTASATLNRIAREYITAGYGISPSMQGGCGGFASLVSDTIFGSGNANPARKVPVEQVRPGDIICKLDANGEITHLAVAASRINDTYEIDDHVYPVIAQYDGNHSGKILYTTYQPIYSKTNPYATTGEYVEVWTRYPSDNTTPWTGSTDSNSTPSGTSDTGTSTETSTGTGSGNTGTNSTDWAIWSANKSCDLCGGVTPTWTLSADRTRHICSNCDKTAEGRNYIS